MVVVVVDIVLFVVYVVRSVHLVPTVGGVILPACTGRVYVVIVVLQVYAITICIVIKLATAIIRVERTVII